MKSSINMLMVSVFPVLSA